RGTVFQQLARLLRGHNMNAIVSAAFLSSRNHPHVIEHADGAAEFAVSPQLSCHYDRQNAVLWSEWAPRGVPCFNIELLRDFERAGQSIESYFAAARRGRA